ncbi:DUF3391 domain-containing protein, partial [Rhodoferax sp.]|uniref:DUF3391 domain-containing protein n=1 Tax=Rhodoferax sp. TaxID=50421 RepID=UPI002726A3AA
MNESLSELIDLSQLRIGMFIELELGWMSHPFPKGSFKISSDKQIEIIRGLGLDRVRYVPAKSDLAPGSSAAGAGEPEPGSDLNGGADLERANTAAEELRRRKQRSDLLSAQERGMAICERRFGEAIRQYKLTVEQVNTKPRLAMEQCVGMVNRFVSEMLGDGESAIRLLSDGMGDKASMHPVNVTIISLLLGKSLGLAQSDMVDLGMAAFLHDIGKTELPDRVRWLEENFS